MRSILAFLFFVSITVTLNAATIRGKIVDSKTKSAIDFANVALFKFGETVPLKGVSTTNGGTFVLSNVSEGKFLLKLSFMGYSPIELPVSVIAGREVTELGVIQMVENSTHLNEVKVQGQKSQMRFELDRKVFDVGQNIAAAGASASEILKNIPSVEVDVQGNVSLRNNSNVIIWINGRPSGLNEDNRAQVLEQMPAETIEKIEVITNPSSKFSPDGSAGIINIVLKKDRKAGYYGSVSGGLDTFKGVNGSVNINMNTAKFDLFANVGYRGNKMPSSGFSNRTMTNATLNSTTDAENKMGGLFTRLGGTYHASKSDLIGLSLNMHSFNRGSLSDVYYESTLAGIQQPTSWRAADNDGTFKMGGISLDYTHQFAKPNHELKASVEINKMQIDNDNSTVQYKKSSLDFIQDYTQRMVLGGGRNELEVQIDYTLPLTKDSKFEAGYKGEFDKRESTTRAYINGLIVDSLNNEFNSGGKRNSLYMSYSGKMSKLSYQLGLRGEYNLLDNTSYNYDKSGKQTVTPFNKEYPGLYPSAFVSYEMPHNNEIQLNYTRRINRPNGRIMNPYRDISDPTNIKYGNPDLDPEYANSLELNHIKTWTEHTLSTSLFYRTTEDVIQQVDYFLNNVKYTTSVNVTNTQNAGMEFILKDRLFKFIDLTSTLNLYYQKLDAFTYQQNYYPGNESFAWTFRSIANVGLPKGWMVQLIGGYQSKKQVAQGEILDQWSLDAGVRKMFFNRKVSLNIMARDIFNSRLNRTNSYGTNFTDYSEFRMGGRMLGFTVTYNFGNSSLMKKKPEAKRNGQNDNGDMMNGGGEF